MQCNYAGSCLFAMSPPARLKVSKEHAHCGLFEALMSCVLHQLSCIAAVTAWRQTLPAQQAEASCLIASPMYVTELLVCSHKIDTTCTCEWTRASTNPYSEENDQRAADMCKCLCCRYDVAQQPEYNIHFGMADTLSICCIADQV